MADFLRVKVCLYVADLLRCPSPSGYEAVLFCPYNSIAESPNQEVVAREVVVACAAVLKSNEVDAVMAGAETTANAEATKATGATAAAMKAETAAATTNKVDGSGSGKCSNSGYSSDSVASGKSGGYVGYGDGGYSCNSGNKGGSGEGGDSG